MEGGDEAGVKGVLAWGNLRYRLPRQARQVLGEVGGDFEELGEVGIVGVQQVVEQTLAHQDHLDLQRDGLGFKGGGAGQAQDPLQGFDADLAGAQHPLEAVPGEGVGQQAQGIEDQIAAVGTVQGAGLDQGEVGGEGAHAGDVFDTPDQIEIAGIVLVDDRGAVQLGVVHQQVDPVTGEGRIVGAGGAAVLALALAEEFAILDHVLAHRGQVVLDRRQVGIVGGKLGHEGVDRPLHGLLVEDLEASAHLLLPQGDLAQGLLQVFPQFLDDRAELVALLLGQGVEVVRGHDVALAHRRQGVAIGGVDEGDALVLGLAPDGAGGLLLPGLEFFLDLLSAVAIVLALEGGGDGVEQVLHQLAQVGAQVTAAPRRQAQGVGALGVVEVGDVTPVVRGGGFAATLGQHALDQGMLAEAGGAHEVKVVAAVGQADTQVDGLQRSLLTQAGRQGLQFAGVDEVEAGKVGGVVQIGCRQERTRFHGLSSFRAPSR